MVPQSFYGFGIQGSQVRLGPSIPQGRHLQELLSTSAIPGLGARTQTWELALGI